jgi:hypothetical protein
MGVPKELRKGFELYKFYQHFGGGKMHIIAQAHRSEMFIINNGSFMFIAEERDGSIKPVSNDICSCTGYFEISKEIFVEDLEAIEYHYGQVDKTGIATDFKKVVVPRFCLRVYRNNEIYMFDLLEHYDDDGLYPNILKNDVNGVFAHIRNYITPEEMFSLEKLLLERM